MSTTPTNETTTWAEQITGRTVTVFQITDANLQEIAAHLDLPAWHFGRIKRDLGDPMLYEREGDEYGFDVDRLIGYVRGRSWAHEIQTVTRFRPTKAISAGAQMVGAVDEQDVADLAAAQAASADPTLPLDGDTLQAMGFDATGRGAPRRRSGGDR